MQKTLIPNEYPLQASSSAIPRIRMWPILVFACLVSRKKYVWLKIRDTKGRTITVYVATCL